MPSGTSKRSSGGHSCYAAPAVPEGAGDAGTRSGLAAGARDRHARSFRLGNEGACSHPDDGHVAMIPVGVPAVVQAMVVAGNELQDLPYGPLGHPDPLGATQEDCSSTVNYVLYRSGVRPLPEILRDNPLAQDYVDWGEPGPGRWVTIYATDAPTPHVFIVIAGLRLDTSHNGTDVGPNRAQDGPRWRILPTFPRGPTGRSATHLAYKVGDAMGAREVDYLLIGGGLASANCARWLREDGAEGEVLLVGRELDPPYNRPECSKGYLRGEESREEHAVPAGGLVEGAEDRAAHGDHRHGAGPGARTAKLSNKEEVSYGKALLASGANVRRLNVDGAELESIYYLRTLGNAAAIREGVEDAEEVVLIGGSYIGCEVAASLTMLGKRCSIVMLEQHNPRTRLRAAGRAASSRTCSKSTASRSTPARNSTASRARAASPRCRTKSGLELPAQAVVIGAGVTPELGLARRAGLEIGERGGVACSSRLASSAPDVFAAGDICEYESVVHGGRRIRIEHWDVAFNQGKTAALNMLGRDVPHEVVPYFYSVLGDWGELEYVGPASEWDEEIVRGSTQEGSFTNWYLADGRVVAALTVGRSDDLDHARRLLAAGVALDQQARGALADADGDLSSVG